MNIEDIGSWVLDATPGSKDNAHNALYDKMEEVGLVEYSHGATEKEYVAIRNYNSRAA